MTFGKRQETVRPFDGMHRTICGNCPAGCGLKVFVRNGRVVDIHGDEDHPVNKGSVCPKGLLACLALEAPRHLTQPRIRDRLEEDFRTVDWSEALEFVTGRLSLVMAQAGPEAVHVIGAETDPFDYLSAATLFAARLGAGSAPFQFFPPALGDAGRLHRMLGVSGARLQMNPPRDWAASRGILIYRSDPAAAAPMTFGPILDARDRGAWVGVIDSRRTISAARANQALVVAPGTESLALKGLLRLMLDRGAIDQDFVSEWTADLDGLRRSLAGVEPGAVAGACRVTPAALESMARQLASRRPLQVVAADTASRAYLADDELCLAASLVALTGSIGVPGGGLNLLAVSPFNWARTAAAAGDRQPRPPLDLGRLLISASPGQAFMAYGNPLAHLRGGQAPRDALARSGLVVRLACGPGAFDDFAHVVLPMTWWLESDGLLATSNGRMLQWQRRVATPPPGCRNPLAVWAEISARLRLEGGSAAGDAAGWADDLLGADPLTTAASVTALDPEANPPGGLLWPCTQAQDLTLENSRFVRGNSRGRHILFLPWSRFGGSDKRFPTPGGRIVFQPVEAPFAPVGTDADHPLALTIGAVVDATTVFGPHLSNHPPHRPRPLVRIHPRTARTIGVSAGDRLTVANARGAFSAPAQITDELPEGLLFCPEGLDHHVPDFHGLPPAALFALPAPGQPLAAYTPVTAYAEGSDPGRAQRALARLLAGDRQGPPPFPLRPPEDLP